MPIAIYDEKNYLQWLDDTEDESEAVMGLLQARGENECGLPLLIVQLKRDEIRAVLAHPQKASHANWRGRPSRVTQHGAQTSGTGTHAPGQQLTLALS